MSQLAGAFGYAIRGLAYALRTQQTLRIHLGIAVAVAGLIVWLQVSVLEAAILVVAIVLVVTTELLNTAVEVLVDLLVERNRNVLAKMAKDIAAGAVLVTAVGAAIVGILILGPLLGARLGLQPDLATLGSRVGAMVVAVLGVVGLIRSLRISTQSAYRSSPTRGDR